MRTGRPRMVDGTKKASTFSVRLTAEERGVVELAAKRVGVRASEWARQVLLASAHTCENLPPAGQLDS